MGWTEDEFNEQSWSFIKDILAVLNEEAEHKKKQAKKNKTKKR